MEILTAQNIFLDENTGGKGRHFTSRFLQPGLVKYSFGVCLLAKETIDKFIYQFVGCPVIINHKDVTNESAKDDRMGVVSRVWFDQMDGWYWCEGIIFEEQAISLIEDGYNVSCQYEITEYSNNTTKALHNGNPYDKVILNGKPEHLAIVKTPRYEAAMIAVNALDLTETLEAENAKGFGGEEGDWITVNGVHIFIKKGESKDKVVKEFIESKQGGSSDKPKEKENEPGSSDKPDTKDSKDTSKDSGSKGNDNQSIIDKYDISDISSILASEKKFKDFADNLYYEEPYKNMVTGQLGQELYKLIHSNEKITKAEWDEKLRRKLKQLSKGTSKDSGSKKGDKNWFGMPKAETTKEQKLEDGISETTDKYGRTTFRKGNKWSDVMKNGNYYFAAYGLTHKTGVSWEDEKGITHEQLLQGKGFKTEKGARKWALEQLKRITADNSSEKGIIIQAINEIKETNMFKNLFKKKEHKMEKDELKELFIDCIQDVLKAQNEEDKDEKDAENEEFEEIEEKEEKAANKKKACNEDKRKLIDEVAGLMKSAGCDNEVIRTAIAKMEKIGYDKSEAGTADNGKKAKCEDEEEKEEALNKAKNSIEELKGLLSQVDVRKPASKYITKADAIELGNKLF